MDKKSILHQLADARINGIMNTITAQDKDYQALLLEVDGCSDRLKSLHLPKEAMHLVDQCVSGYNAIGSRYGMLAYMLGFSDCGELLLGTAALGKEVLPDGLL
ncbi:MAG: hypothetical protein NC337_14505 [Roseburia sp.]|nr:hypothetical protein [Roseburia sp.]